MSTPPFRRGPKTGRNDPCSCGSGRKYKHCHGAPDYVVPALGERDKAANDLQEGRRHFEQHKTRELERQRQQGLGRGIISTEFKGYRFVAVGDQLHYGKWRTFTDFLANFIKVTLGPAWGNAEIAKPMQERHPVMQWYDRLCRLQAEHAKEPGALFSTPVTGAVSAYNRLAYNLYLIAHNGKNIQDRLIARLKTADSFQGAFFETQVAAWLIRAGFELEFEDESDRSSTHCEFTATYTPTGEKFSVEAKSREVDEKNSSRAKVGRTLYRALEKKANHRRLIFLDLNKPLHTPEAVKIALDRAVRIVRQSEAVQVQGATAPAAYVCITNMNDQYVLDTPSVALAVAFCGFRIGDFMGDQFPSLRDAARARERHWPMFQLFKSMEEHREVPQTFGGELPSEVFSSDPRPRIQIGGLFAVPGPDGAEVNARITSVTVVDGKAVCGLSNPSTNESWLGSFEMTADELADYARHPETYFGELHQANRRAETPMELFDFFVNAYRETPHETLLKLLSSHPEFETLRHLPRKDLVEALAEGYTWSVLSRAPANQSPRNPRDGGASTAMAS